MPAPHADMVFSQLALKRTREHTASAANTPVGGLLTGRVHLDPTWGRRWVLVEDAVRAGQPLPEDPSADELEAVLGGLIDSTAPSRVVGWYLTHARRGVYLSEEEARLHQKRFGQPWQCALILVGNEQHPVGGVFQPTDHHGLSRSVYTPFFELVDPSSEFSTAWKRTFVGWSNYQTEISVALAGKAGVSTALPSERPAARTAEPPAEPIPDPTPERVSKRAPEPVVEPAPEPVVEPAAVHTPEITPAPPSEVVPKSAPEGVPEPTSDVAAESASGQAPEMAVAATPVAAPAMHPVEPKRAPKPAAPASAETDSPDAEEAWSEVQIRRSLSAVGRTLGPSGLSSPRPQRMATGGPEKSAVEAEPESDGEPPPARTDASRQVPEASSRSIVPLDSGEHMPVVTSEPDRSEPDRSEPEPPEPDRAQLSQVLPDLPDPPRPVMRSTLVGGSRRQAHMPTRTIAVVAAGVVAVLGGGWLVQGRLGGGEDGPPGDGSPRSEAFGDTSGEGDRGTSIASLPLGQGRPLFSRQSNDRPVGSLEPSQDIEGPVGPERPERGGDDEDLAGNSTGGSNPASDPANEAGGPSLLEAGGLAPPEAGEADPRAGDAAPMAGRTDAVDATDMDPASASEGSATLDTTIDLSLSAISLDDPAVAAFEDAFAIFRREVSRYDDLRRAFDDQLEGCNALNLSYRLVGESFDRLTRRFERAREQFAGPGLQAFRNAQRQAAVIDRHYELSECPVPVGG